MTIDRRTPNGSFGLQVWRIASSGMALVVVFFSIGCGGAGGELYHNRYTEGVDLYQDGRIEQAVLAYEDAVKERPDNFRAHYNLAVCRHDLFLRGKAGDAPEVLKAAAEKNAESAMASYREVLRLDPGNPRAISGVANLMKDRGDAAGGLEFLKTSAPNGEEGSANLAWMRGSLQKDLGQSAEAKAAYVEALALDEGHLEARTALAEMLIKEGALDEAEKLVTEGLVKAGFDFTLRLLHARIAVAMARRADLSAGGSSEGKDAARIAWETAAARTLTAGTLADRDFQIALLDAEIAEQQGNWGRAVSALWAARAWASDTALVRSGYVPDAFHADVRARLKAAYGKLGVWEDELEAAEKIASK